MRKFCTIFVFFFTPNLILGFLFLIKRKGSIPLVIEDGAPFFKESENNFRTSNFSPKIFTTKPRRLCLWSGFSKYWILKILILDQNTGWKACVKQILLNVMRRLAYPCSCCYRMLEFHWSVPHASVFFYSIFWSCDHRLEVVMVIVTEPIPNFVIIVIRSKLYRTGLSHYEKKVFKFWILKFFFLGGTGVQKIDDFFLT